MTIYHRDRKDLGEGRGIYRCRYYVKGEKKYRDIEYRYGGIRSKEEALALCEKKRDEFRKALEKALEGEEVGI